jgi:hypothetical protein
MSLRPRPLHFLRGGQARVRRNPDRLALLLRFLLGDLYDLPLALLGLFVLLDVHHLGVRSLHIHNQLVAPLGHLAIGQPNSFTDISVDVASVTMLL